MMIILKPKALVVFFLLWTVVETASLPRIKVIGNDIPVLKTLEREGYRSSHSVVGLNTTLSWFEQQTVDMIRKSYTRPSLISVHLHPNASKETSPTNRQLERQRIKRSPQPCVKAPVARCERNRIPECLVNVGCKGTGSCGGTCREFRVAYQVLKFKGVSNGVSIWQPDVIVLSADCVCS